MVALSGALYGTIYAYERLTWTNQVIFSFVLTFVNSILVPHFVSVQAKLKEFKRQYVDHAARKLRLIVDMTSANCSHQVLFHVQLRIWVNFTKSGSTRTLVDVCEAVPLGGRVDRGDEGGGEVLGEGG